MSNMPGTYENSDVNLYQEPERTSIMAILSLVFGVLGCCTFVTAPVGVLLGVFGIFGISRSKGRVGGMGLAIGGLIVSILSIAIWAGIVFGVGGAMKVAIIQFGATTEGILTDVQNGDFDSARAQMIAPASDVSDADFAAFYASYKADLGDYVGLPSGIGELFSGYGAVGQQIQAYNGRPGFVPMPVRFDSGWILVIYVMETNGQGGGTGPNGMPPPKMLMLIGPDGQEYTLPADAGDNSSVNRPADGGEVQTPDTDQADESGEEDPEGP